MRFVRILRIYYMNKMHIPGFRKIIASLIILIYILPACNKINDSNSPALSSLDLPQAEVLFLVEVPSVVNSPGSVALNIVDEVTGLALNPNAFKMQKRDDTHFSLTLPINIGTVLKYRYTRSGAIPIMEVDANGKSIRYRIAVVGAPLTIYDVVPAWEDYAYQGNTGKITGSIIDDSTSTPVPNVMVTAGGLYCFSASDGSFTIDSLPPGTHNLVAYTLDGSYLPFQQGATIDPGLTTPADIKITHGQSVNITFLLKTPPEYDGLPVRLAGSISQLGNTFGDLSGGTSAIASRMPIMAGLEDNRRYATISVSAGTYIEYKYTLGDGFWNSELDNQGKFRLRGLVVPPVDTILQDEVISWIAKDTVPIIFEVDVPTSTPRGDRVSIQFNPYGWMEPIPMWQKGENHWVYTVFNPLNLTSNFTYRYCRNEQCGLADDIATPGYDNPGRALPSGSTLIQDKVVNWQYLTEVEPVVLNDAVISYSSSYLTGIELSPKYHPSWQPYLLNAMKEMETTGANTIVFTPSWTCWDHTDPQCDLLPGVNPTWQETYEQIWQTKQLGLKTILFPSALFPIPINDWWASAPRSPDWWHAWFVSYKRFITNFADLAQQSGVNSLVIGGDWIEPSLPGGKLSDGTDSLVPPDSIVLWIDIINSIRSRFSGNLIWEMNYPYNLDNPPPFLSSVDSFYISFSGPISQSSTPSLTELQDGFAGIIDSSVYSLFVQYDKPVIIGVDYPSAVGSAAGCSISQDNACGAVDVNIQTSLYQAALTVVNYRDWLSGFISQDFYPPARLVDPSSSIHGKPVQDLLGYWYSHITNSGQ